MSDSGDGGRNGSLLWLVGGVACVGYFLWMLLDNYGETIRTIVVVVAVVIVLVLVMLGVFALRGLGSAPSSLASSSPPLVPVFDVLRGRVRDLDEILCARGVFLPGPDGAVQRPSVEVIERDRTDSVRVKVLPGTWPAWVALACEFPHLIGEPVTVDVVNPPPGYVDIDFQHTAPPEPVDPLAEPVVLDAPVSLDDWVVSPGLSADGRWVGASLRDRSGVLFAGQPGSGKSVGLLSSLVSLTPHPSVQFVVIDGKGGSDLAVLEPRCIKGGYISSADDLERVAELLRWVESERTRRMDRLPEVLGVPNFWTVGPTPGVPLLLVVVDEVQALVNPSWWIDKGQKALAAEISSLLLRLITQGRSAGLCVILSTQKPTSDAVPTALTANCGVRVAYSLATRQAADAALGEGWAESGLSPVGEFQGVAVMADGSGRLWRVRTPLLADGVAQAAVTSAVAAGAVLVPRPTD